MTTHQPADYIRDIRLPRWAKPFTEPATFKTAYGGRASSKTWTVAHLLVAEAYQRPLRIACGRQFQSSISVSAKPALEVAIHRMGLDKFFKIYDQTIRGANGSLFFFKGLERNPEEIRGWESVDRVWIEEAQTLSPKSARIMIDTVIRHPGVQIWFTWNPRQRTDWVWQRFVVKPRNGDVIRKINWDENPWLNEATHKERLALKESDPDLYVHVWEGEPEDESGARRMLPYKMVEACVDACTLERRQQFIHHFHEGGLDIADGGGNQNAFVTRRGPLITHVEQWRTGQGEGHVTALRADRYSRDHDVKRIYYDAGGVGAGPATAWKMMAGRPYAVKPIKFGAAVAGPKVMYNQRETNQKHFMRRNAQMGWAVRLRAENTMKLLKGNERVPLKDCLLIDPAIPNIKAYLAQLAQPQWRESMTSKVEVVKVDEEKEVSPDMYDATILAFAADSARGLKARW